jgi:hypothetical protein
MELNGFDRTGKIIKQHVRSFLRQFFHQTMTKIGTLGVNEVVADDALER